MQFNRCSLIRRAYRTLPLPGISSPVFIVGCGRSGTTVFGTALSKHRSITYLNEPRQLWFSAYPEADIWSSEAESRNGKLVFTAADVTAKQTAKLSRLFKCETVIRNRPVLVEKLPINTFRLGFINAMFPDARYIHIYRNGLEVARSIEQLCNRGEWFVSSPYKWKLLSDYANTLDDTRGLPAACESYFDKGLLEWRLSTDAAVSFLRRIPSEKFIELSYARFMECPSSAISRVLDFIGTDSDSDVEQFLSNEVSRRSSQLHLRDFSSKVHEIGGELLPVSMGEMKA